MDVGKVLKQHFAWVKNLPRVKPFYAVKCNNNPVLLAVLAHLGCSFDCASLVSNFNTTLSFIYSVLVLCGAISYFIYL